MPPIAHEQANPPILETARLRLRPLTTSDLATVMALAGDPGVAEQTARIPHPLTEASVVAWYQSVTGPSSNETVFAITSKGDGSFLGVVGLIFGEQQQPVELGFWLGRPYWNEGYMTQAVRRVLDYAFTRRSVPAVRACTFLGNAASARVQEKVGMRPIGNELRKLG